MCGVAELHIKFGRAYSRKATVRQSHSRQKNECTVNCHFEIAFFQPFLFGCVGKLQGIAVIFAEIVELVGNKFYADFPFAHNKTHVKRKALVSALFESADELHKVVCVIFVCAGKLYHKLL